MEHRIGSILLADCGTITTKVILLDRVAGQYHLVACGEAPTTAEAPWSDISVGVRWAAERITEVTGRRFFDGSGNLICPELAGQQGVDVFSATVSAPQPLQMVLCGLVRDLSVASAERAAAGTYTHIQAVLAADSVFSEEERVRRIRDLVPDVIGIVGGTEGGASASVLELAEAVALASTLIEDRGKRPSVIYAGNSRLRERVAAILGGRVNLRVTDNVRPSLNEEAIAGAQMELDALYMQEKMSALPGIEALNRWSRAPLEPTVRAFGRLVHYLGCLNGGKCGVLGVDVGGAHVVVAAAFNKRLYTSACNAWGTAVGLSRFVEEHGPARIVRWVPTKCDPQEIVGWALNRELRPLSIPQTEQELWFEQALTRELMRAAVDRAQLGWRTEDGQLRPYLLPRCDTILVSGGVLAHAPQPSQAALVVLDALEPVGVTTLALDTHGLAAALGHAALIKPLAAVETLDNSGFLNLATVVAPVGPMGRGEVVLHVRMTTDDDRPLELEVRSGEIEVLPLEPGQQALLELHPARRIDVGMGRPGRGGKWRVSGGLAGVIVDARGRPLRLPADPHRRQQLLMHWRRSVGG